MLFGLIFLTVSLLTFQATAEQPTHLIADFVNESLIKACQISELEQNSLLGIYRDFAYQQIWDNSTAQETRQILINSANEGLNPNRYCQKPKMKIPHNLAGDIMLTLGITRYLLDQRFGRLSPNTNQEKLDLQLREIALHRDSLRDYITTFQPPPYQKLLDLLAHLKATALKGGWPKVDTQQTNLEAVTAYLQARQFLDLEYSPEDNAKELKSAIKAFQKQHSLLPDGIIGPQTRAVMSKPITYFIDSTLASLERLRSLNWNNKSSRMIIINIPTFRAVALHGEQAIAESNVIVGTRRTQSVPLSSSIEQIVINPYWHVPQSIIRNEILPELKANPQRLKQQGIRVFRKANARLVPVSPFEVDWQQLSSAAANQFVFRQDPGRHNSLGRLKMIFPNPYSIYLHDTPQPHLFKSWPRAFSHGCIRIEDPFTFAAFLLNEPSITTSKETLAETIQELKELADSGKRRQINLNETIPIEIVYTTVDAWSGNLRFGDDIYGLDQQLLKHLNFFEKDS